MIRRLAVAAFVLLSLTLSSPASAQSLTLPASRASVSFLPQSSGTPTWQEEFDAAQAKKASAKKKMLIGVALVGVGTALTITSAGGVSCEANGFDFSCDSGSGGRIGLLASLAGTGLVAWGAFEFYEATNELNRIGPRRTTVLLPLGTRQAVVVTSNLSPSLGYAVSW